MHQKVIFDLLLIFIVCSLPAIFYGIYLEWKRRKALEERLKKLEER